MIITKDTLLKLVKATRMADRLAQDAKCMLPDRKGWTVIDEISEFLYDALFEISGERLKPEEDFMRDSNTMYLIRSRMSDEIVRDVFYRMNECRDLGEQPKPNTISKEAFNRMYERNGGYRCKELPEGERT